MHERKQMNASKFKTIREALGLSAKWIAEQANVQIRTALYWESGRIKIPDDVIEIVKRTEDMIDNNVRHTISIYDQAISKHKTIDTVVLLRYRNDEDLWFFKKEMQPWPNSTHGALIFQTYKALKSIGAHADIVFMEKDQYLEWLNSRKDSESLRSEWASNQITKKSEKQ